MKFLPLLSPVLFFTSGVASQSTSCDEINVFIVGDITKCGSQATKTISSLASTHTSNATNHTSNQANALQSHFSGAVLLGVLMGFL